MSRPAIDDPSAVDASIHLLAHQLLGQLADGALEPCLLHVQRDAAELALGLKPLDGAHPSSFLLGFVAPTEWYALGFAASGWAYHREDRADRATAANRRRRVHTVTLLARSGEMAQRTHVVGDPELSRSLDDTADQAEGEQIDLLRLALELPTAPPPCDTGVYWAVEWLASILALDQAPTTWDEIAAAHPAMVFLGEAEEVTSPGGDLVEAAGAFARVCTWARLREMAAVGTFDVPELVADDAQWLDEGAFARFLLSRCPPLSMVRGQVIDTLPDALAVRLDATLDELGIPRAAWPDEQAA